MDNNKYWFRKRKGHRVGWGYTPINWRGWVSIAVWSVFVLLFTLRFGMLQENPPVSDIIRYSSAILIWVIFFIWFCERKTDKTL